MKITSDVDQDGGQTFIYFATKPGICCTANYKLIILANYQVELVNEVTILGDSLIYKEDLNNNVSGYITLLFLNSLKPKNYINEVNNILNECQFSVVIAIFDGFMRPFLLNIKCRMTNSHFLANPTIFNRYLISPSRKNRTLHYTLSHRAKHVEQQRI